MMPLLAGQLQWFNAAGLINVLGDADSSIGLAAAVLPHDGRFFLMVP